MIPYLQLPMRFDPVKLQEDLAIVHADEWRRHFNLRGYKGDWSIVALRHQVGATHPTLQIAAHPECKDFVPSALLSRCLYFTEVLSQFHCPLRAVRLMRLHAGASILEHTDTNLCYEQGEARIHIPITTNSGVAFMLNGERVDMSVGEVWYLNFDLPHSVVNSGETDRTHLVLDCDVNPWITSLFQQTLINS